MTALKRRWWFPLLIVISALVWLALASGPVVSQGDCSSAPPDYVTLGDTIRILGAPSIELLREFPTLYNSPSTGSVEWGEWANVFDGPACADGYRWWYVIADNGVEGWMPDGEGTHPYFEILWSAADELPQEPPPPVVTPEPAPVSPEPAPVSPAPVSPAVPPPDPCSGAPAAYLYQGLIVSVSPGNSSNNVRSGPGTANPVVGQIFPGDAATIIGGPVCADSYRWWQVSLRSGVTGWTADGVNGETWLTTEIIRPAPTTATHRRKTRSRRGNTGR